jgi:cytoskeletal protein RodZ
MDTWPDEQLMKYKVNNSKMEALAIAVIMVILSTTTMGALSLVPSNVFAASDKQEETNTEVEESDNEGNDEQNADTESESETEETETEADSDTETEETEVNEEQEQEEVVEDNEDTENGDTSNTNDIATLESAASDNPNGNDHVPGDNEQPNRVGSHDDQTSGEGANAGGTATDPTIPGADGLVEEDGVTLDEVTANCFGKVISHEAQEHKDPESGEGTLGEHSSDPVPEIPGNETPRQGIGNQDQGHPAAHGAFNSNFDDDDAENVNENCDPNN